VGVLYTLIASSAIIVSPFLFIFVVAKHPANELMIHYFKFPRQKSTFRLRGGGADSRQRNPFIFQGDTDLFLHSDAKGVSFLLHLLAPLNTAFHVALSALRLHPLTVRNCLKRANHPKGWGAKPLA